MTYNIGDYVVIKKFNDDPFIPPKIDYGEIIEITEGFIIVENLSQEENSWTEDESSVAVLAFRKEEFNSRKVTHSQVIEKLGRPLE